MKGSLAICILILIVGLLGMDRGWGTYDGIPVESWAYYVIAAIGFVGGIWHLWAMYKEKKTPREPEAPLDEQYAQAKAELDRMYFREHGKMPEWPEAEAIQEKEN